ncbi:DNA repair protein RadA [Oceanococcus atlanticus]|uniref:DNA repair protein RadA n=2 Tax=Oceanococcus atlanticus TaxID=1317117 RepID=A0A1Y1SHR3_9GAMM|nr:DNA repair protein RadA [Oceanococcus atlanticus]
MLKDVGDESEVRIDSGFLELDRVLGGGIVTGSVVLLGGDPGIGKSTLLLQLLIRMQSRQRMVYVTGEESLQQVRMRAQRLGEKDAALGVVAETEVESILALLEQEPPALLVIDSIQTLYTRELSSAPGSVAQLRECCALLVRFAKQRNVAIFLVGHVTKEGVIAGPRVLEHMVDTVLYFEADPGGRLRMIRAAKNRFGAVNEIGFFAMADSGLKEVRNPSALFLARDAEPAAGSVVLVTREGSRSVLVEVQALVDRGGSSPRRVAVGLEANRLAMLLAVLHRHAQIGLLDQDVFINVVGGLQVRETAADLATVLAAVSSFRDRALPGGLAVFGELGLSGELRPVSGGEERIAEAAKQGFSRIIVPQSNKPRKSPAKTDVLAVRSLSEALDAAFS